MLKQLLFIIVILLGSVNLQAQDAFYKFEVKMDSVVQLDKQIRVSYEYSTNDSTEKDIPAPNFKWDEESGRYVVIMSSATSTAKSFNIVNGKTVRSFRQSFYFIMSFLKEGTFTMPSMTAKTKSGKILQSKPFNYRVTSQPVATSSLGSNKEWNLKTANNILVMDVNVNKTRVNLGDTVECEFRQYTGMDITQWATLTSLSISHACWEKKELPAQRTFEEVEYKGRKVRSVLWDKISIVPYQAGKVVIEPMKYNAIWLFRKPYDDPFKAFFRRDSDYVEKDTIIKTNPVTIQVDNKQIPSRGVSIETTNPIHRHGIVVDRSSSLKAKQDSTSPSFSQLENLFLKQFLEGTPSLDYSMTFFAKKPHYPTASDLLDIQKVSPSNKNDGSAIYDAILASALREGALTTERSPFSILLLTDGHDNVSRLSEKTLTNILLKHKIRVDVVVFACNKDSIFHEFSDSVPISKKSEMIKNVQNYKDVERIAKATNGLFVLIENESQIPAALRKIRAKMQMAEAPRKKSDPDFAPEKNLLYTLYKEIMSDAVTGFK